jgi:hypothetical protein
MRLGTGVAHDVGTPDLRHDRLPCDAHSRSTEHLCRSGALRDICSEYAPGTAAHAVAHQAPTDEDAVKGAERQIAAVTAERDRFAQQVAELRSVVLQGGQDACTIRRRAIAILACQDTEGTSERAQIGAVQ